jgi:outer membrane protein assembly factor BamD
MTASLVAVVSVLVLLTGCGSSEAVVTIPADERFRKAMELFREEEYLESISEFTIVTLQHQGSAFADSAQFFIAEARFARGEFLVAATEYDFLRRSYPSSPLVPSAQYKLALSYYNLAPVSALDQKYTRRAIDELQEYAEYHPKGEHIADVSTRITELNNRLAKKSYESARLYETLENYRAALFCFDDVIERFHDTEYAPLAYIGKVEVLMARRRFQEARAELQRFYDRFPESVLKARGDRLKEQIDGALDDQQVSSGKPSGKVAHPRIGSRSQQPGVTIR